MKALEFILSSSRKCVSLRCRLRFYHTQIWKSMHVCDVVCICGHSICNQNKCEWDLYERITADQIKQPGKNPAQTRVLPLGVSYWRAPGVGEGMCLGKQRKDTWGAWTEPGDTGTELSTCFLSFFSSKLLHLQLHHPLDAGGNKFGNCTSEQNTKRTQKQAAEREPSF